MSFTLVCHGAKHLDVQSQEGHLIRFAVRPEDDQLIVLDGANWKANRPPLDSERLLEGACRFARRCAWAYELV